MVTRGPDAGIRVTIGGSTREFPPGSPVTIGRGPGNNVISQNEFVSREHAVLTYEDGAWVFENRSQHGSSLQGRAVSRLTVTERVELVLGDMERGDRISVEPIAAAPAAATRMSANEPTPVPAPGGPVAGHTLRVRVGPQERVFRSGENAIIGRSETADLRVESEFVSREHVRITHERGEWVVENLGQHGTYLDGTRIDRMRLTAPATFRLGDGRQGEEMQVAPGPGGATQLPPGQRPGATQLPGGPMAPGATGQTSIIQRLSQANRRTQVIAAIAAALALILGVVAVVTLFVTDEPGTEEVAAAATPKTVVVHVDGDSAGSGWVLDAGRGLIVTNQHVVDGAAEVEIGVGDSVRSAELVSEAPCEDLALVRVDDTSDLESFELADRSAVAAGEPVVALGYPVTFSERDTLVTTAGEISVARTDWPQGGYADLIQHTASVNPGNSGGPLVDLDGRLVGVNTLRNTEFEGRAIQGQYYAISSDVVRSVADDLTKGTDLAFDGIGPGGLAPLELQNDDGSTEKLVLITEVEEGSPAAEAGIEAPSEDGGVTTGFALVAAAGDPIALPIDYCDAIRDLRPNDSAQYRVVEVLYDGTTLLQLNGDRKTITF